jgi:glutamine synthetase
MADNHGNNLLEPGSTPQENAQFLVFLTAVVRALHLHGDLMRASIATPSNDHRLGANEAPPAIISVYLGDTLTEVVEAIIGGKKVTKKDAAFLNIGVNSLPPLPLHDSDRNRTSPFAFTGNKFEFRAVGSGQNIARPNMVINAIVAESLNFMADEIEKARKKEKDFNKAVQGVVQRELTEHQAVLFGGDNYSIEWHEEAAKRGLPNLKTAVDAFPGIHYQEICEALLVSRNIKRSRAEESLPYQARHLYKDAEYRSRADVLDGRDADTACRDGISAQRRGVD